MSVSAGNELPEAALAMLDGSRAAEHVGKVILLLTVDEAGFPHVAQLSAGEVVATGRRQLRLAVFAASHTTANIRRTGDITLALVEPGLSCYVKARATVTGKRIQPGPTQPMEAMRVDARVEDVVVDSEVGAAIVAGPRYRREASREEELSGWESVRAVLTG